jgi:hypothetical protein
MSVAETEESRDSIGNDTPSENMLSNDDEVGSLAALRERIYVENPGVELITLNRDGFLTKILGMFKSPRFQFLKEPQIEFKGELGNET